MEEGNADGGHIASENLKDLVEKQGLNCFCISGGRTDCNQHKLQQEGSD